MSRSRVLAAIGLLVGLSVGASLPGCAKAPSNDTSSGAAGTAGPASGGSGETAGKSGTTGAGGTSGAVSVMNPPSSYPQNTAGATFPYPQGHLSAHCAFPVYNTDIVATAYTNWKAKFFDGTKVVRPENGNDAVSEGIGYGMLIAVFMNDKPMFDTLWSYAKSKLDGKGLMTWCMPSGAGSCSGSGSATDGDEDMAYALLMATKQWSGGTYSADALALIKNILKNEVSGGVLEGGDSFNNANELDPSYFTPSYYRAFAAFDTADSSGWMAVLDKSYSILASATGADGLVPNWVNTSGAGVTVVNAMVDSDFGYDACRVPFRIGMDYCINGEPRAQTYAQAIAAFYSSKSTATSLSGIVDGYTTTGGKPGGTLGSYAAGMAFTGPAGVAAMAAGLNPLRDIVYATLRADTTQSAMKVSGTFSYYHASWGVLSLMAMSGNFWDMTQ
jgi:endo-1,4-beta-D-glucanase Y